MVLASALFFPHVPQFPRIILLDTVKSPNRTRIRALRVGKTTQKRYLLTEIGPYLPSRLPPNYFSDSLSRSTLAIWPCKTPHRLSVLRRPLGLFASRSAATTRKNSPY